jgi:hypothetical protein
VVLNPSYSIPKGFKIVPLVVGSKEELFLPYLNNREKENSECLDEGKYSCRPSPISEGEEREFTRVAITFDDEEEEEEEEEEEKVERKEREREKRKLKWRRMRKT